MRDRTDSFSVMGWPFTFGIGGNRDASTAGKWMAYSKVCAITDLRPSGWYDSLASTMATRPDLDSRRTSMFPAGSTENSRDQKAQASSVRPASRQAAITSSGSAAIPRCSQSSLKSISRAVVNLNAGCVRSSPLAGEDSNMKGLMYLSMPSHVQVVSTRVLTRPPDCATGPDRMSPRSPQSHHAIAVIGTLTTPTPSDKYHPAEEYRRCSALRTNPLRRGLS
jgi:hypothetical protein